MRKWKNRNKHKNYLLKKSSITTLANNFKDVVCKVCGIPLEILDGGIVKINSAGKGEGRSSTEQPLYMSIDALIRRNEND